MGIYSNIHIVGIEVFDSSTKSVSMRAVQDIFDFVEATHESLFKILVYILT